MQVPLRFLLNLTAREPKCLKKSPQEMSAKQLPSFWIPSSCQPPKSISPFPEALLLSRVHLHLQMPKNCLFFSIPEHCPCLLRSPPKNRSVPLWVPLPFTAVSLP